MTIPEYLGFLFDLNEKVSLKRKLTDEQLAFKLLVEFKGNTKVRDIAYSESLSRYRRQYNNGTLSKRVPIPRTPSWRYGRNGIILSQTGSRPRKTNEIISLYKEQFKKWERQRREELFKEASFTPPKSKPKYQHKRGPKPKTAKEKRRLRSAAKKLRKEMAKLYWLSVAQERRQARTVRRDVAE